MAYNEEMIMAHKGIFSHDQEKKITVIPTLTLPLLLFCPMDDETVSWIHVHMFSLHDMVQHFDHVLHHLTSTAIKEHVPPTAQHGGKRQRGLMEATVIKFFRKWSRTRSVIIFRKTPSKKREIRVWKSGFFKTNYNGWR